MQSDQMSPMPIQIFLSQKCILVLGTIFSPFTYTRVKVHVSRKSFIHYTSQNTIHLPEPGSLDSFYLVATKVSCYLLIKLEGVLCGPHTPIPPTH